MTEGATTDASEDPRGGDAADLGENVPQLASDVDFISFRHVFPDLAELDAFFELHNQKQHVALPVHGVESWDRNRGMLAKEQKGVSFILRHPWCHAVLDDELVSNADDLFVSVLKIARECLLGVFNLFEGRERTGNFCWIAEIRERLAVGCGHGGTTCTNEMAMFAVSQMEIATGVAGKQLHKKPSAQNAARKMVAAQFQSVGLFDWAQIWWGTVGWLPCLGQNARPNRARKSTLQRSDEDSTAVIAISLEAE